MSVSWRKFSQSEIFQDKSNHICNGNGNTDRSGDGYTTSNGDNGWLPCNVRYCRWSGKFPSLDRYNGIYSIFDSEELGASMQDNVVTRIARKVVETKTSIIFQLMHDIQNYLHRLLQWLWRACSKADNASLLVCVFARLHVQTLCTREPHLIIPRKNICNCCNRDL